MADKAVTIFKGDVAREKKEKEQIAKNNTVDDVKAAIDYNIMMGNLEDPME